MKYKHSLNVFLWKIYKADHCCPSIKLVGDGFWLVQWMVFNANCGNFANCFTGSVSPADGNLIIFCFVQFSLKSLFLLPSSCLVVFFSSFNIFFGQPNTFVIIVQLVLVLLLLPKYKQKHLLVEFEQKINEAIVKLNGFNLLDWTDYNHYESYCGNEWLFWQLSTIKCLV